MRGVFCVIALVSTAAGCKLACNASTDCGLCDDSFPERGPYFCYPATATCVPSVTSTGDGDEDRTDNTITIILWILIAVVAVLSCGICMGMGLQVRPDRCRVYPAIGRSKSMSTRSNPGASSAEYAELERKVVHVIEKNYSKTMGELLKLREEMKKRDDEFFDRMLQLLPREDPYAIENV
jgi:hypothetical protein